MTTRRWVVGLAVALHLSVWWNAAYPEEAPRPVPLIEREEVRFVTLDVVVEEKRAGEADPSSIRDLRREQFRVTVGGREMPLDLFENRCGTGGLLPEEAISVTSEPARGPSPSEPGASPTRVPREQNNAGPGMVDRYVLYFDLEQLTLAGRNAAFAAATRWAGELSDPSDEVMIVMSGYGLRIVRPMRPASEHLVEDLEAMKGDLPPNEMWAEGESRRMEEIRRPGGRGMAMHYADVDYSKTRRSLENLRGLVATFQSVEGIKYLLLFVDTVRLVPGRQYGVTRRRLFNVGSNLGRVTRAANENNVRIYPVQQGVETQADSALTMLATETGGRYTERTNRLEAAFERVASDASCFYRIGFRVRPHHSGRSETIYVRILGGERIYRLRHRRTLDDPTREQKAENAVLAALLDPSSARQFPVAVSAIPLFRQGRGAHVNIQVSVAPNDLLPLPSPGPRPETLRLNLEFGGQVVPIRAVRTLPMDETRRHVWADVAVDRATWTFGRQAVLSVPAAALKGDASRTIIHVSDVDAPPGDYRVVALVRDRHAEAISAAVTDFHVEEPAAPLGEAGLAVQDPHSIILGVEEKVEKSARSGRDREDELVDAPPVLPRGVVVRTVATIETGRPTYVFYSVCDTEHLKTPPKRDKAPGANFEAWKIGHTLSCGATQEPLGVFPVSIPEPVGGEACVPVVERLPLQDLQPGPCRLEVALERPGAPTEVRALEFRISAPARP